MFEVRESIVRSDDIKLVCRLDAVQLIFIAATRQAIWTHQMNARNTFFINEIFIL